MSGKKGGSSHRYMARQLRDPFVRKAQAEQFRARSSFKLLELLDKHKLVPPRDQWVVDCGAAPGGWSQVVARRHSRIVAVDLLPMQPIAQVRFVQGDFLQPATKAQIAELLGGQKVGLLLSDMAPSFTGHHAVDAARTMALCEDIIEFSGEFLALGGSMVVKFFMGGGEPEMRQALRRLFERVCIEKPAASRRQSSEQYFVCIRKLPQDSPQT
ncbi:ribosomal RNA methyltransferase [Coemansia spiralis]|nr:ribosomal RNA methyltransferase [Coemansia spiralis]